MPCPRVGWLLGFGLVFLLASSVESSDALDPAARLARAQARLPDADSDQKRFYALAEAAKMSFEVQMFKFFILTKALIDLAPAAWKLAAPDTALPRCEPGVESEAVFSFNNMSLIHTEGGAGELRLR